MNKRFIVLILLLFLVLVGLRMRSNFNQPVISTENSENQSHEKTIQTSRPTSSPNVVASSSPLSRVRSTSESWKDFQEKFGRDLQAELSPLGNVVSIRGGIGTGVKGDSKFSPDDAQKAIDRASEIVESARDILGIRQDWPLEKPVARVGSLSAQVFFSQTHQGLVLAPVGNIKVDLGPQGELIGLYSDYAPQLRLVNQAKLTAEEAKLRVISVVTGMDPSQAKIDGGNKVIWVNDREARVAYQFMVDSQLVVIDAQTGEKLFQREKRIHFNSHRDKGNWVKSQVAKTR